MKFAVPLLNILVIAGLCYYAGKTEGSLRKIFWPALFLKFLAGISLGLLYEYHYQAGDTFSYFHDGRILAVLAEKNFAAYARFLLARGGSLPEGLSVSFQEPRALFFIRLVSIFNLITRNNYWVISLYFSFFSFLASWFLVKRLHFLIPGVTLPAVVAFLFFPSVVFWSSGIIKESLAVAALFFLSGLFLKIWFSEKIRPVFWLPAILSIWILWELKYYFAAVFLPVVFTGILYKLVFAPMIKPRNFFTSVVLWMTILILPLSLISFSHPNFYPQRLMHVIVDNYNAYTEMSEPNDLIRFEEIEPAVLSIVRYAPKALFSGLFRPFLWEADNVLKLVVSLENLVLAIACAIGMSNIRRVFLSRYRMLILSVVVYIVVLCIFITLSTPNFGTLSRYRTGYLPFFIFLLLCDKRISTFLQRSFDRLVPYNE